MWRLASFFGLFMSASKVLWRASTLELRVALDQEAAVRRATAAKLSSAGAALASDHAASLRRLEALHKIELEKVKATAVAARQLELDRFVEAASLGAQPG